MRAKLVQDAPYVAAQGTDRDVHFAGHLCSVLARHDPLQHLPFTRCEFLEQFLRW